MGVITIGWNLAEWKQNILHVLKYILLQSLVFPPSSLKMKAVLVTWCVSRVLSASLFSSINKWNVTRQYMSISQRARLSL